MVAILKNELIKGYIPTFPMIKMRNYKMYNNMQLNIEKTDKYLRSNN